MKRVLCVIISTLCGFEIDEVTFFLHGEVIRFSANLPRILTPSKQLSSLRIFHWFLVVYKMKNEYWQGLFQKVRGCVRFLRKRAKKGKIFVNLGKNVQNLQTYQQTNACSKSTLKSRKMCEICSKLTIKTPEPRFEQVYSFL